MRKVLSIFLFLNLAVLPATVFAQGATSAASQAAARMAKAQAAAISAAAASVASVPIAHPSIPQIQANTQAETDQSFFTWIETFIRTTLMKTLLDQLVDQIIGFIQGDGEPKFVTDWQGFLADAGNQAAGKAFQEIEALNFLCSPFSAQLQIALFPETRPFSERAQCTLDKVVGNIQDFYDDFQNGGWIAYGTAWLPQNNFYGSFLNAASHIASEREKATFASWSDALAGAGFPSLKDKAGNIITPGTALANLTNEALTTDIKFVLSAGQLGDYVGAIANSLINRIIKEGVAGAKSATSRSERETAAAQNESITENNFDFIKSTTLNEINQTLSPHLQTKAIMESTIANLEAYITNLQSLHASFSNLSVSVCGPTGLSSAGSSEQIIVDNVKAQITAEIAQAESNIDNFELQKANLEALIEELQIAKSQIEPLQNNNDDFIELTSISQSLAGLLDPAGAANYKTATQEQTDSINQNINSKLAEFNSKLQQCQ